MKFKETVQVARENKEARGFPGSDDPRHRDQLLFPIFRPKFPLTFGDKTTVFAIGSCFARNIEDALEPSGVRLPTHAMTAPEEEKAGRPHGLLNEFTPGAVEAP